MAQALAWAAMGTLFLFLMTTLGAAVVFLIPGKPHPGMEKAMLGFAGGVMTAASVWSLLLPAIAQTEGEGKLSGWIPAAAGLAVGALFLAVLDGLLSLLQCQEEAGADTGKAFPDRRRRFLLISAITLHNIPEGMAVGLACALSVKVGNAAGAAGLAAGIGIQNFPEGAAVALPLRHRGKLRAFGAGTLSGVVEPVSGILAALAAAATQGVMPWLLSFAAGAMLYVTVEELIPAAHSRTGTFGYLTGFLLMMVLDVALG